LKAIDDHIKDELKSRPEQKRDWRTYEQMDVERISYAINLLKHLIHEAVSAIHIYDSGPGRPSALTLEQKVKLLLIKQLVGKSNREFAYMLEIFSMISSIDISYKTVERLYSDELVMMALHNLHVLLLKKGIKESDATGDGTGYSLTVKKNYESYAQELKDKAKENRNEGDDNDKGKQSAKKAFAYSFRLMDLKTKMYIAFGSSMKSEKEAFDRAINFIKTVDVKLKSVRLDRYYSESSYVSRFASDTAVYIIKNDATLNESQKWKDTMREFVIDTYQYLKEYYKRENSEATDKKLFGLEIAQRREDRIDSALFCTGLWHNLFNLNR